MAESETACHECERLGSWRNLPNGLAHIFCQGHGRRIPVWACHAVPALCRDCIIADAHLELLDVDGLLFCRKSKNFSQPRQCWARPKGTP
jgi:hypothetical protein